ncbi:serine carboxypeptidase-like 48 isoform X2 [Tripterygium wilfordii]|nr:serine carboxypeptidase-like 48 isoform X2 [Tripterygium wilfordii]XP_038705561.1 serine carboxypeptidase-like 48 isoform X2 [Tripterygium wilfordii]XP_038705562.1 serine carboxypeptidase-like 48 isoform X2 [Tripterygium wilfordii]XP_038705564.1 serine carboxypeptidase-like 48 isoform X2 [Tripterygium wilfordii]
MFYFFFESRTNKNDPVVIWLAGGPGCGGEIALFYENGPFHFAKNLSLVWNKYGWDKVSNLLYVDQPIGTGFSYTTNDSDLRKNQNDVTNDLYDFLQDFFTEYREFDKHDFFITGESYAGHYAPALASKILQENKDKRRIYIHLKGIAIGNGLINPGIQYPEQLSYALSQTLIIDGSSDYLRIRGIVRKCKLSLKTCGAYSFNLLYVFRLFLVFFSQDYYLFGIYTLQPVSFFLDADGDHVRCLLAAYDVCSKIMDEILSVTGNINYYDIRKDCEGRLCYDFSNMEKLMNDESIKKSLGVGADIHFVSCNSTVSDNMKGDFMKNYQVGIPALLENGIKILIYAGDKDVLCNWQGNLKWVLGMKWYGDKIFKALRPVDFFVDGDKVGELRTHKHLSFVKINKAGHLVPMDQPKAALQMIETWMQDRLSVSKHVFFSSS